METYITRRYNLNLSGDEIDALGSIFQLARQQLAINPPEKLHGCPLERQAGLIGPQLYRVRQLLDQVVEDLGLPDVSAPAAPEPLLLEAPVEEATPAEPIEAPVPAAAPWQWHPEENAAHWFAGAAGAVWSNRWTECATDYALLQRGNVYRTREEAEARARLDDELALSAHLRQLGGGDSGRFAVRYDEGLKRWGVLGGGYDSFGPGEARFESFAVAVAARDKLRQAGLLPREQLAPVAAGAPAEVPSDTPPLNPELRHAIMVLLLTPPGWPAPPEVWEAIHMAAKGPQS